MGERHPEYERDDLDYYVEPAWCADDLFRRVFFDGTVHDPACGSGTIYNAAKQAGLEATCADILVRDEAPEKAVPRDWLQDPRDFLNIVTNPPYQLAQQFAEHAFKRTWGVVAMLVQAKFLFSQKRHLLFTQPRMPLERVIIYSRRPSMPPGELLQREGESCRGGGSIDFCWVVWRKGYEGKPTIEWSMG